MILRPRTAAQETQRQAEEEEARRLAEAEAQRQAADAEAQRQAEEAARQAAEAEAQRLAEEEARQAAEAEAHLQAEEEALRKAEAEAQRKAIEEAQRLAAAAAAAEAQKKLEEERLRIAQIAAERKKIQEELERLEAEAAAKREAKRKAEEEAQRLAEAEAQRLAEEEAQRLAEEEAQRLAEEEAQRQAEAEAQRLAEEEAQRLAEEEAQRQAEAEAQRLAEEEASRLAEAEAAAQLAALPPEPEVPTWQVEDLSELHYATRGSNLRSGPGTEFSKVGALNADDEIMVTGKVADREWYRVAYAGSADDAYIYMPLVKPIDPNESALWQQVRLSKDVQEVEAFVQAYPDGRYTDSAIAKLSGLLAALEAEKAEQAAAAAEQTKVEPSPNPDVTGVELAYWALIVSSEDPRDYQAYLEAYPDGQFVALANRRIESLSAAQNQLTLAQQQAALNVPVKSRSEVEAYISSHKSELTQKLVDYVAETGLVSSNFTGARGMVNVRSMKVEKLQADMVYLRIDMQIANSYRPDEDAILYHLQWEDEDLDFVGFSVR